MLCAEVTMRPSLGDVIRLTYGLVLLLLLPVVPLVQEYLDYASYLLNLSYSSYDLTQHLDGQPLQVSVLGPVTCEIRPSRPINARVA